MFFSRMPYIALPGHLRRFCASVSSFSGRGLNLLPAAVFSAIFLAGSACTPEKANSLDFLALFLFADNSRIAHKFDAAMLPDLKPYVDSVFITKNGNRIYFLHSIYAPLVMNGTSLPGACPTGRQLPDHITVPGLEWNSDLYYIEWSGSNWSSPVNLGSQINTFGNECCIWLNDAETETIFYRGTDLDGDGVSGDLGLPPSGNYQAFRTDKNAAWGPATALSGTYGVTNQANSNYRHDIHKVPSNNYYLWERDAGGNKRLLFGVWNGLSYDAPTLIPGSVHEDTQIWAADDERTIVYNHRTGVTTDLYQMKRASSADPWSAPAQITTVGFEDPIGGRVWGEPAFDSSLSYMLYVRFNTADTSCWSADLMYAPGNLTDGFGPPITLTR
jgi:hypothetical protein